MKKVNLILFIIGLIAISGAGLAFNISYHGGSYFCTSTTTILDPNGNYITCEIKATTGLAAPKSGRCTFGAPAVGYDCGLITRWGNNG